MTSYLVSCAALCRRRALRVIAIAIALSGCGGSLASPADGGPADGSVPSTGCPSYGDIDTQAAVGKACAPEGTYCLNPTCDPCNMNCPAVKCTQGTWTPAVNTALCTSAPDASPGADAGAPDARVCIDIDPTSFDQTCKGDSDCFEVTGGTFCGNGPWCMCGGASINVDDQSRYEAALADLRSRITPGPGGCFCPYLGSPRCVHGLCTLCGGPGGANPGCPDGG